ncbi:hypothetical protein [Ureibacillus chungkukjangi]|uniref:Uncharacterized protein n=1 Tax=Ureibacillus chungkukjangi TaxID=1202712 RepID=A0A318TXP6_9BACL|nr:hypothetical protein [Ureibacillus chungkukjangi]PYF06805.1 hypothetical protein BJ095_10739 [Ureibacillus chungkukjangi]
MKRIKKFGFLLIILTVVLLAGCVKEETLEEYFHKEMTKNLDAEVVKETNYSYALVHQELNVVHENDGIAIFTQNSTDGEQIYIAYMEKEKGIWNWRQSRGAEWDTPVKWSAMHQSPYIYSGAISDNAIKKVYAGDIQAKIIQIEGDKRFWYANSSEKDVEVKMEMLDGTQQVVDKVDVEMLKNWNFEDSE